MTYYKDLIDRLRNATAFPILQSLMNEAADVIEKLSSSDSPVDVSMSLYDEVEVHTNCTVQIWKNSVTGDVSVGWFENEECEELES